MDLYLTPEEAAAALKLQPHDIMDLIQAGHLRAFRIGDVFRIREADLGECVEALSIGPTPGRKKNSAPTATLDDGSRLCSTFGGNTEFRVRGSISEGAEVWPGQMRYPIRFPREFMEAMLRNFQGQEVRIGGSFGGPDAGTLGHFIQEKIGTKMNPAVYLAGLLIDEGFAERTRRGYIRFHPFSVVEETNTMNTIQLPTATDFEREIKQRWSDATFSGASYIDVVSGDVHRTLGGYPSSKHRMPDCCQAMRRLMRPGDQVMQEPPRGRGATLKIRYRLPRSTA